MLLKTHETKCDFDRLCNAAGVATLNLLLEVSVHPVDGRDGKDVLSPSSLTALMTDLTS